MCEGGVPEDPELLKMDTECAPGTVAGLRLSPSQFCASEVANSALCGGRCADACFL